MAGSRMYADDTIITVDVPQIRLRGMTRSHDPRGHLARWRYQRTHRPAHGDPDFTVTGANYTTDMSMFQDSLRRGTPHDRMWFNSDGHAHRDFDLPAEIRTNKDGRPRELIWRTNGYVTRANGLPARINVIDREYEWTDENGLAHSTDDRPAFIGCDRITWKDHGIPHRALGPAVIRYIPIIHYPSDLPTKKTRRHATCQWWLDGLHAGTENDQIFTLAWDTDPSDASANRWLALMPNQHLANWLTRVLLANPSPHLTESWRVLHALTM